MKKTLAILAALTTLGFSLPTEAAANWGCNQTRIVGYTPCRRPIIAVYRIVGYDFCGNPIGQWVTQPTNCNCRNRHFHHPGTCNPGFNNWNGGGWGGSGGGFFFRFGR